MRKLRKMTMAKGWETIRTDRTNAATKADVVAWAKVAAKVIGSVKSKDFEGLKKEGIDAHADIVAREDFLLAGNADGRLKSETLKEEAAAIEKRRAAAKAKNEKKGKAKGKAE